MNETNGLRKLADEIKAESVFLCRKCWTLFENPDELESIPCPNCTDDETEIRLIAETRAAWMSNFLLGSKRDLSPEARKKMSDGARLPHPRGPQSAEAKAKHGGWNFKHGFTAKVRNAPRAAHGRLAACKGCPFAAPEINPAGNGNCLNHKWTECGYQIAELFAFAQSYKSKGMEALKEFVGDIQGKELFVLKMALDHVIREGVTVEDVIERDFGEKGSITETRIKLNPSIDAIGTISRALGGIGLSDFLLTPKSGTDDSMQKNLTELTGRLLQNFDPHQLPSGPGKFEPTEEVDEE